MYAVDPVAGAARDRGSFASVGGFQGGITPGSGLIRPESSRAHTHEQDAKFPST